MPQQRYLVALGSNVRHPRLGRPEAVLRAGLNELGRGKLRLEAASPVIRSAPLGPSRRRYANAVAIVRTAFDPPAMLRLLQQLECAFGRQRRGERWRSRVLDLDIVLWNGGAFANRDLIVPHIHFRERGFVLGPAARIAPDWRDPVTGLTPRHLLARLTRPRAILR